MKLLACDIALRKLFACDDQSNNTQSSVSVLLNARCIDAIHVISKVLLLLMGSSSNDIVVVSDDDSIEELRQLHDLTR